LIISFLYFEPQKYTDFKSFCACLLAEHCKVYIKPITGKKCYLICSYL